MKKALSITLAGMLFTIEEDAYDKLSGYLKSVQSYFGSYPDSAEIIKDIEARMAEQLMSMHDKPNAVVTIVDVEKLISIMGRVEDFGEKQDTKQQASQNNAQGPRRLMRDPDDEIIAGVASGFAAYFGIDVTMMRVIFIVVSLILGGGGAGIVIYIILALVLPKASTPAEKVMMHGGPISLESFKENFSEMGQNIKKNSSDLFSKDAKPRNILDKLFRVLGKIIVVLVKVAVKIIGIAVAVIPAVAIAVLTFAMFTALFNGNAVGPASAIYNVIPHAIYYLLVISLFIVGLIPLILIFTAGKFLLRLQKPPIRLEALIGLILFWVLAGAIVTSIAIQYVPQVRSYISTSPEFQPVSKVIEVGDFTKLDLHGIASVHLAQGTTTMVMIRGRQADIDRISFSVQNNTLTYKRQPYSDFCLFCNNSQQLDITITMPKLESIKASGAVTVNASSFTSNDLSLDVSGVSKLELPVTGQNVRIEESGASSVTLSGVTEVLNIDTSGVSKLDGSNSVAKNVTVKTSGASDIRVNASATLDVDASGVSKVYYRGTPKVTSHTSGSSKVESE